MAEIGLSGLTVPDLIVDGTIHRFKPEGDKRENGWYVLFRYRTREGEELITGAFGSWRDGSKATVKLESGYKFDPEERDRYQTQLAEKRALANQAAAEVAEQAAERARGIWNSLPDQGGSDYLTHKKRVPGYGLRYSRGGVVVPMRNVQGVLRGLQFIRKDGADFIKKNLSGIDPKGCFHLIGNIKPDGPLVIAEGYSTGATIHKATDWAVAVAFTAGNLEAVAARLREAYPHAKLIIAGDDDRWNRRNDGRTKAQATAHAVKGVAVLPHFPEPPAGKTDFNDLYLAYGLEIVTEQLEAVLTNQPNWREKLLKNKQGAVTGALKNINHILQNDPAWAGVIGYDEFSYRIMKLKPPPWPGAETGEWNDFDGINLRLWLSNTYGVAARANDADDGVLAASLMHKFHPVRDYLHSLEWDGIERVDYWMPHYLDTPGTDYDRAIGRKFLIAAVARVMQPGCKMDYVLILESLQGIKKSTVLSTLANPWFSDTHFELGSKDGYQQMQGVWLYELAELDSFNKAESTRAKQFFGSQQDRFRAAYGRRVQDFARQCVFIGTTNLSSYLKDPTGNRRYWPVCCGQVDIAALSRDRDQLWAEACLLYQQGENWWPSDTEDELFREEQEKRFQVDVWEDLIFNYLNDPEREAQNTFTGAEIFEKALRLEPSQMKHPEITRLGQIMHRLNWLKSRPMVKTRGGNRRTYVYNRPPEDRMKSDDSEF